jgi:hypothetical protein
MAGEGLASESPRRALAHWLHVGSAVLTQGAQMTRILALMVLVMTVTTLVGCHADADAGHGHAGAGVDVGH